MIKGKPQLTYGSGQIAAPQSARQRTGMPQGGRVGSDFASYLPQQGAGPRAASPNAQYAFQAQALPQARGWDNGGGSLGMTTSQMRMQTMRQAREGNVPAGGKSFAAARAQGNNAARSLPGMTNVGGMLQQPQVQGNKSPARISGRPVTGRGEIGMEKPRQRIRSGRKVSDNRRAATQEEVLAAMGAPESLGIMNPGRSRLAAMGPDPYSSFAARFQAPGLHQSFVSQGFASQNAKAVLQSQGYDLSPARKVRTSAQLLPAPVQAAKASRRPDMPAARRSQKTAALPSPSAPSAQKKTLELPKDKYREPSLVPAFYAMGQTELGSLAAKFESGEEGIAAIGYDLKGGTSYGKYQISSRAGTMKSFIAYLRDNAPDLAQRLSAAGPANTGGRRGKMPTVWRQIASEDPVRFEKLQSEFVRTSHFEPAIQGIAEATGLSFNTMPKALQEVLFSTAVQHGPVGAVRIVSRAVSRVNQQHLHKLNGSGTQEKQAGRKLIENIYQLRAGQFVSSTARVRGAVKQRLQIEMREALQMFG